MPSEDRDIAWAPVHVFGENRSGRWLVLCDHAANRIPPFVEGASLGVSDEDMARHIAYDIGAAGVALRLAERLGAPAVMANFSRLVIDPNRGEDDPTLIRRLYDETIIPGNRKMDEVERQFRLDACYRPYHQTVERMAARRKDTAIVSLHSFTPQLRHHEPRPWHVGLLYAEDRRLTMPLLALLRAEGDLVVGENEPYSGHLPGDTIDRHATRKGRQNTLIEIRSDLIEDDHGQAQWADRLARLLPQAIARAEMQGA